MPGAVSEYERIDLAGTDQLVHQGRTDMGLAANNPLRSAIAG
jgi:hypothetical protein